jgi:hypothetical protein
MSVMCSSRNMVQPIEIYSHFKTVNQEFSCCNFPVRVILDEATPRPESSPEQHRKNEAKIRQSTPAQQAKKANAKHSTYLS